jgi:hypothetical protein
MDCAVGSGLLRKATRLVLPVVERTAPLIGSLVQLLARRRIAFAHGLARCVDFAAHALAQDADFLADGCRGALGRVEHRVATGGGRRRSCSGRGRGRALAQPPNSMPRPS